MTRGLLFDLDGTLVDTAPDLVGALFAACDEFGAERPEFERAREQVANGGAGLVALAFANADAAVQQAAYDTLLRHYGANIAQGSRLYPAWQSALPSIGVPWGVVTNKPQALAEQLFAALAIDRHRCMIGGDLLNSKKPAPEPLVYAAGRLGALPQHCAYVGDHARDIQAARAAGMYSIAAAYGYVVNGDDPAHWGADVICHSDTEAVAAAKAWLAGDVGVAS
ncbi:MAG: HAD-IA family hydrolase [Pseudomonadota bacterium]